MKNTIASLIEGAVVGVLMAALLFILSIEATALQTGLLVGGTILSTSIASAVKNTVFKGELPYSIEWAIQYNEHAINVKSGSAEELYINGTMSDKKTGVLTKPVELKGLLNSGEKITAVISPAKLGVIGKDGRALSCEFFVNDEPLQTATA